MANYFYSYNDSGRAIIDDTYERMTYSRSTKLSNYTPETILSGYEALYIAEKYDHLWRSIGENFKINRVWKYTIPLSAYEVSVSMQTYVFDNDIGFCVNRIGNNVELIVVAVNGATQIISDAYTLNFISMQNCISTDRFGLELFDASGRKIFDHKAKWVDVKSFTTETSFINVNLYETTDDRVPDFPAGQERVVTIYESPSGSVNCLISSSTHVVYSWNTGDAYGIQYVPSWCPIYQPVFFTSSNTIKIRNCASSYAGVPRGNINEMFYSKMNKITSFLILEPI
jgi:hypothetical protein